MRRLAFIPIVFVVFAAAACLTADKSIDTLAREAARGNRGAAERLGQVSRSLQVGCSHGGGHDPLP